MTAKAVVEKLVTVFAPDLVKAYRIAEDPIAFAKSVLKPAVAEMPSGLYRSAIRNLMPEFEKAGMSANQTIRFLRDIAGKAYRRTDFLADWREKLGKEAKEEPWKYVRKDYRIKEDTAIPTTRNIPTKFEYRMTVEFVNVKGEVRKETRGIFSDEPLSFFELSDMMSDKLRDYQDEWELKKVLGVKVSKAYYRVR